MQSVSTHLQTWTLKSDYPLLRLRGSIIRKEPSPAARAYTEPADAAILENKTSRHVLAGKINRKSQIAILNFGMIRRGISDPLRIACLKMVPTGRDRHIRRIYPAKTSWK